MADDNKIEILIKTIADLSGVQLTATQLANVKTQFNELNTAANATAPALSKVNENLEDGAKHAEHAHISHRALHQILHLIGKEAGPEAGAAIAGIGAAAGGGILIAIMAVRELLEWIHKLKEETEKLNDTMSSMDVSAWDEQMTAANAAFESTAKWRLEIEGGGKAVDAVTEKWKTQKAVVDAIWKQNGEILAQMEKMEEASAKARKASPSEIDAIHRRYGTQKSDNEIAQEADAIERQKAEKKEREAQAAHLSNVSADNQAALAATIKDPQAANERSDLTILKGKQAGLLKEAFDAAGIDLSKHDEEEGAKDQGVVRAKFAELIKQLEQRIQTDRNNIDQPGGYARLDDDILTLHNAQTKVGEFEKNADKVAELNESVEKHKVLIEQLEKAATESTTAFSANREAIKALDETIKNLQAVLDVNKQGEGVKHRLDEFAHGAAIVDEMDRKDEKGNLVGHINENEKAYLVTLVQAITHQRQTVDSAAEFMRLNEGNSNRVVSMLEHAIPYLNAVDRRLRELERGQQDVIHQMSKAGQ